LDEIERSIGLAHDPVRETDPERLLEAEEKLNPLQATDPQVAVQGVIERHRAGGWHRPQLADELRDDPDHFPFNR
jgi:hypothetical protein